MCHKAPFYRIFRSNFHLQIRTERQITFKQKLSSIHLSQNNLKWSKPFRTHNVDFVYFKVSALPITEVPGVCFCSLLCVQEAVLLARCTRPSKSQLCHAPLFTSKFHYFVLLLISTPSEYEHTQCLSQDFY